jgi:hypothetical protein
MWVLLLVIAYLHMHETTFWPMLLHDLFVTFHVINLFQRYWYTLSYVYACILITIRQHSQYCIKNNSLLNIGIHTYTCAQTHAQADRHPH